VLAFEPNPLARECLLHNTRNLPNVTVYPYALGDTAGTVPLSSNNANMGGAYVGEHMKLGDVPVRCLDQWEFAPDFIKLDVEGYEFKALMGAQKTIEKHHPLMVIEINREALRRQNACPEDIYGFLKNMGYRFAVMQENCSFDSPLYDILCSYSKQSPEVTIRGEGGLTRCTSFPPPVTPPNYGEMIAAVVLLKQFAELSPNHRLRVMQNLSKNGLTPRWPRRKRKKNEIPVSAAEEKTEATAAATTTPTGKSKRPGRNSP
jgi:FkbM family methyltransferase